MQSFSNKNGFEGANGRDDFETSLQVVDQQADGTN